MDRLLTLREVCRVTGLSRWTIRRRIEAGDFPPALEVTPSKFCWRESAVMAWMDNRPHRAYRDEPLTA